MIDMRPGRREDIPALRRLWREAFGDPDAFLDRFFALGFAPERSLAAFSGEEPVGMLYWFDCRCRGEKLAYLYAVAVAERCRGRGLCRGLMTRAHEILGSAGYAGALLVPGDEGLRRMYGRLGYRDFGSLLRLSVRAGRPLPLERLTAGEYASRRRALLPDGAAVPEEAGLAFQSALGGLYAFPGGICAVELGDGAVIRELLPMGSLAAPGILGALGAEAGALCRASGGGPFAMYRSLGVDEPPDYFVMDFD